jgi:DNA-binding NarL/FixJ family response regulator
MEITKPLTIILADDHGVVREGVAAWCRTRPELTIVAQCSDGDQAVREVLEKQPDFAILDLNMPKMTGLEAIRRIRLTSCPTRLLVLSINRDPVIIRELFRNGADGYVLKDGPARHILDAINYVLDGGKYTSPLLQNELSEQLTAEPDPLGSLSHREYQVFSFLVEGVRPRDIAVALNLSPKTVDTYRASIMRKLDIDGIAGLVKFALQRNLIGHANR